MVSKVGIEPTTTGFSNLRVCQLRHLEMVGRDGVEPPSKPGDRDQGYSLVPLPLGQRPKTKSGFKDHGGRGGNRTRASREGLSV
jgi:hypothetical protein